MKTPGVSPILVFGATGGQGGAVADALLAHEAPVRVMVRRPAGPRARRLAERGVEVVAGSFGDRIALAAAMRDVAGAFALTTPFEAGVDAEVAQGRAIVGAAKDARVPHLVFSSVAGADQHTGVPHFDSKAVIENDLGQVVWHTPSSVRHTFSTTRSAGPTASAPESSICRCPPTAHCSSWAARIWAPSPPRCC